ncbi:MAG: site-specific integrase [Methylotenera sp.]
MTNKHSKFVWEEGEFSITNAVEKDIVSSEINFTDNNGYVNCQLIEQDKSVSKYIRAALADNTRKGYQSDLAHFMSWGGSIPSSPEQVSQYLAAHAEILSPATLSRRVVSIGRAHTANGISSPTKSDLVKTTLRGIKRSVSTKQRQVEPVLKNNLLEMINGLHDAKGIRDKAILLIGFAGGFRRSELVGLQFSDVEFVEQGLVIHLRKSKTDQEGQGRKIAIPYARGNVCAVLALKNWLEVASIDSGALFRPISRHGFIESKQLSAQTVAIIVKERVGAVGLNACNFSGHSLRAGLVTSAAQAGVSAWKIKAQTGHRSDAMLNRYVRDARIFIDNAVGELL